MFGWGTEKKRKPATDRRAGKKNVPHVGKQPRSRTKTGAWRKKRSDAGKPKKRESGWFS